MDVARKSLSTPEMRNVLHQIGQDIIDGALQTYASANKGKGTTPNLTTTTTDAWLLAAFYARGLSGGSAIATPSGYTARGEQTFTHTGLTARMALKLKETATAPGTYSADTTNNNSCINALIEIPLLVVSGRTSDFFTFF